MRINNKFDTLDESKKKNHQKNGLCGVLYPLGGQELISLTTELSGECTVKKDPFTGKQGIHILFKDFNSHNKLKQ